MVNSKQRNQFFVLGFHAAGSAFAASREPFVAVFPIHTPTRRASILIALVDPRLGTSIHAPVKGATGDHGSKPRRRSISIHAPVKGATFGYIAE